MTPADRAAEDVLVALGNTDIVARSWEPDGTGVQPDGWLGGDGAGDAVSVRYVNRYRPHARITTGYYVVDVRERHSPRTTEDDEAPFMVERSVEAFLGDRPVDCDDMNEQDSAYFHFEHGQRFTTEVEAEKFRDKLAAADSADLYHWDGEPDTIGNRFDVTC